MVKMIIVINVSDRDAANAFCNTIGADGESFTVQLFNQNDVLTGYWCGWNMTDEQFIAVESNDMFQLFNTPSEALEATGWHVQSE